MLNVSLDKQKSYTTIVSSEHIQKRVIGINYEICEDHRLLRHGRSSSSSEKFKFRISIFLNSKISRRPRTRTGKAS